MIPSARNTAVSSTCYSRESGGDPERLDKHEEWLKKQDALLDNDNKRLSALEKSNNLTMKALLALLKHGIDNNNIDSMRKVKTELEEYLIDR